MYRNEGILNKELRIIRINSVMNKSIFFSELPNDLGTPAETNIKRKITSQLRMTLHQNCIASSKWKRKWRHEYSSILRLDILVYIPGESEKTRGVWQTGTSHLAI